MPTPKSNTDTTKAIRINETLHPNLSLNHSDTPKIITFSFLV